MTLPAERTRAIQQVADAARVLRATVRPGTSEFVRVRRADLLDLWRALRHYPTPLDLESVQWGDSVPEGQAREWLAGEEQSA
jgi:hypothetical protein